MKRHSRLNEAKQNISKVIPCLKMTIILLHISLFLDHTYVHNMKIHICQQISFSTTQALKKSQIVLTYTLDLIEMMAGFLPTEKCTGHLKNAVFYEILLVILLMAYLQKGSSYT